MGDVVVLNTEYVVIDKTGTKVTELRNRRKKLKLLITETEEEILKLYEGEFSVVYDRAKELYPKLKRLMTEHECTEKICIGNEDDITLVSYLNIREHESYKGVIRRLEDLIVAKQYTCHNLGPGDGETLTRERKNFLVVYAKVIKLYEYHLSKIEILESNTCEIIFHGQVIYLMNWDNVVSVMTGNLILKDLLITKIQCKDGQVPPNT